MAKTAIILSILSLLILQISADCDNWDLKTDHKCYKLDDSQTQDYDGSKALCKKLSAKATLVTIESAEEQQLLINFVFKNRSVVENVWLGAKKANDLTFVWDTDYPVMNYQNWDKDNQLKSGYDCAEMEPDMGGKAGHWMSVPCKKRNIALCQIKLDSDNQNNTELEKRFNQLSQQVSQFMTEMSKFRSSVNEFISTSALDLFPVGFIYFQLPTQLEPQVLWPKYEWKDVSDQYDSLFFRVLGKNSNDFGTKQASSGQNIAIQESNRIDCKTSISALPSNQFSDWIVSGGRDNTQPQSCMQFKLSSDEVRPINTAIKVFRRMR